MLTMSPDVRLQQFIEQSFVEAVAFHGNLELELSSYANHMVRVLQKHCGRLEESAVVWRYIDLLHTRDIYLAVACAHSSNPAWQRFQAIYQRSIYDTALYFCRNRSVAEGLAGGLPGHLFLPDTSDHPRIQSYDGQASLINWLRAIIAHQAIDERQRKFNHCESLAEFSDLAEADSLENLNAKVRTNRYSLMITHCLQEAASRLSKQERLYLNLRYEKELTLTEIGELFQMSHANVVYHIRKAQRKLRQEITAIFKNTYHLGDLAMQECRDEILENPIYSILAFIPVE